MGNTIFYVLRELCNTPNNEAYTSRSLLRELVITKTNSPFYGFGEEEIKILINQGYISYQVLRGDEKLQDYDKCIIATPKAFELVEAHRSRISSNINAKIALLVGLIALFISIINLFKEELVLAILVALLTVLIIGSIFHIIYLRKWG